MRKIEMIYLALTLVAGHSYGLTWAWGDVDAIESRERSIEASLERFTQNSSVFMNEPPLRFDSWGRSQLQTTSVFSEQDIRDRTFVQIKAEFRNSRMPNRHGEVGLDGSQSAPEYSDIADFFVDRYELTTLEAIQAAGLNASLLPSAPWSDTYWPIYAGVLAQRYSDSKFPNSFNWKENSDYILAKLIPTPATSSSIEALSPAEKYELVIGDTDHVLSRMMIEEGRKYYDQFGKVESWMGICHGWAPASFMLQRPVAKINVMAFDGQTQVPFYPSDIKGLASALWAYGRKQERYIGSRCDVKQPKTNAQGRIIEPQCFDTNPATWHLAVVNQIGVAKRSLILDATYDYQVWNQPIVGYKYTFFNPQTGKAQKSIDFAKVLKQDFSKDKFKEFRSLQSVAVVGIGMDLTYVVESSPSHAPLNSEQDDGRTTVRYFYDLEIDSNGKIIGGEWYNNLHPDFLWLPEKNTQAKSLGDESLDREGSPLIWDGLQPVPVEWKSAGIASSRMGQPLGRIVNSLITLSRLGI